MRHRAFLALISLLFAALLLLILIPVFTPLRLFTIDSGSMVPKIPVGSVVFVNTNSHNIAVGEIIAFHPPTDPGQVFAHEVKSLLPDGAIRTEGIAVGSPDPWTLGKSNVLGQVTVIIPLLGWIVRLLPVFSLLVLLAVVIQLAWDRLSPWPYSRVVLSGCVFTLTLVFLFDGLDPLIQSSVIFHGTSSTAVSASVINGGWLPLRAFTVAAPGQLSPPIPPNSEQLVHFSFPASSAPASVIDIRVIPALNLLDWLMLALVCLVPILVASVWIRNEFLSAQKQTTSGPGPAKAAQERPTTRSAPTPAPSKQRVAPLLASTKAPSMPKASSARNRAKLGQTENRLSQERQHKTSSNSKGASTKKSGATAAERKPHPSKPLLESPAPNRGAARRAASSPAPSKQMASPILSPTTATSPQKASKARDLAHVDRTEPPPSQERQHKTSSNSKGASTKKSGATAAERKPHPSKPLLESPAPNRGAARRAASNPASQEQKHSTLLSPTTAPSTQKDRKARDLAHIERKGEHHSQERPKKASSSSKGANTKTGGATVAKRKPRPSRRLEEGSAPSTDPTTRSASTPASGKQMVSPILSSTTATSPNKDNKARDLAHIERKGGHHSQERPKKASSSSKRANIKTGGATVAERRPRPSRQLEEGNAPSNAGSIAVGNTHPPGGAPPNSARRL